jgi:hypothetical protein
MWKVCSYVLLLITVLVGLVSCSDRRAELMARQLPEGMREAFMEYYDYPGYKAFAVAFDDLDGPYAFASWYNASREFSAKGNAILQCKKYLRNQPGIESQCRLFAFGNEMVIRE